MIIKVWLCLFHPVHIIHQVMHPNENSIYGKIILLIQSQKISIFSMGHRVVQGLTVNNEIIIATEHVSRGGDEINI